MAELQGKRVESVADVWEGEPGDYFAKLNGGGAVECLWFKLPVGNVGRIAAKGHGKEDEPEWEVTVNEDGTVTVDPSIEQHAIPGHVTYWHGHLVDGVWRG